MCVKPLPRHGVVESFTLRLAPNPLSSVAGGARLSSDHVTCTVEPRGLVQFSQQSRDVTGDVTGTLSQVLTNSLMLHTGNMLGESLSDWVCNFFH